MYTLHTVSNAAWPICFRRLRRIQRSSTSRQRRGAGTSFTPDSSPTRSRHLPSALAFVEPCVLFTFRTLLLFTFSTSTKVALFYLTSSSPSSTPLFFFIAITLESTRIQSFCLRYTIAVIYSLNNSKVQSTQQPWLPKTTPSSLSRKFAT